MDTSTSVATGTWPDSGLSSLACKVTGCSDAIGLSLAPVILIVIIALLLLFPYWFVVK